MPNLIHLLVSFKNVFNFSAQQDFKDKAQISVLRCNIWSLLFSYNSTALLQLFRTLDEDKSHRFDFSELTYSA